MPDRVLAPKLIPVPQRIPDDFKQWGPRVGLAWNVGSAQSPTVVRAAWGLYYAISPTIFMPAGGGGKTAGIFCFSPTCFPTPGFPYLLPSAVSSGINDICNVSDIGCPGPNIVEPDFRNPKVSSLTAGIEHTFAKSWVVTGTFAWVNSQHLRTGGYGTEEAWYRNFVPCGGANQPPATDQFGRSILCGRTRPHARILHKHNRKLRPRELRIGGDKPHQAVFKPLPVVRELSVVAEQGQWRQRT